MSMGTTGDFEQIVNAHQRAMLGIARRMIGNAEDAEEIVQDAFVRAHRALGAMDCEKRENLHLKPWLFAITRNVARNRLRWRRRVSVSLDAPDMAEQILPGNTCAQTPESFVERWVTRQLVEDAMRAVPDHRRTTARLYFLDGLTHTEIAECLHQPLGTVKSCIHRAKVVLCRRLRSEFDAA